MNIKSSILLRVRIAFLLIAGIAGLIIFKLFTIQYASDSDWVQKSENRHLRLQKIPATRGNIYSDNGSLLATSLPKYKLAMDPMVSIRTDDRVEVFKKGIDTLCIKLSEFYGDRTPQQYKSLILNAQEKERQYLLLNSRLISFHDRKIMESWPIFEQGRMKGGVVFQKVNRRFTPFKSLAKRTVGKLNRDTKKGQFGIEFSYDSVLSGVDGEAMFVKVGGGWKPINDENSVKVTQGLDVHSTIDVNLQDVTEYALRSALVEHQADHGCVIVMEVSTGEIKAMANLDKRVVDEVVEYKEIYNYSVAEGTEPGSTFKLASLMAILEERPRLSLDHVCHTGNGKFKFFDITMRDSKYGGYGDITLQEVFEKSSNIGVAQLAFETFYSSREKQNRFVDYFKEFGLSTPMNFQLKGEAVPEISGPEDQSWSGVSIPFMSIGYEMKISPLQILTLYNAVANDGYYVKPRIVNSIRDANRTMQAYDPETHKKRICSEATLEKLQKCLLGVVESGKGTAKNIKSDHYKIAGKTGTTHKLEKGVYINEYYASFAGYFPADNPKYSCIVAIDNPQAGKHYGAQVAAPVFREIADRIYSGDLDFRDDFVVQKRLNNGEYPVIRAGFYEDLNYLCQELQISHHGLAQTEWVKAYRDPELRTLKWKENTMNKEEVPDVVGMTLKDALPLLENMGFYVTFEGSGRIKDQSQTAGSRLIIGSKIRLSLG